MKVKKTMVRVPDSALVKLDQLFKTRSEGVNRSIEAFMIIRDMEINHLKGYFTNKELMYLLMFLKDAPLGRLSGIQMTIYISVSSSQNEGEISESDLEALILKISDLPSAGAICLQEEIYRFYNGPGYGNPLPDPREFIKTFS